MSMRNGRIIVYHIDTYAGVGIITIVKKKQDWILYILECKDGSLYTGITTDVKARLARHECGRGARYTRGRGPLKVVYTEVFENKSQASKREIAVKKMSRAEKLRMLE